MRAQKIPYALISLFLLAAAAMLSGCSSGGGKSADSPPLAAATATTGVLKLDTVGTPNTIAGLDLTVSLPAGVTIDADSATGETAAGVVSVSGSAADGTSLAAAKYSPASNGIPARLRIVVVSAGGFPLGEFATIKFNLAPGTSLPAVGAFIITNFSVKGPDSSALSGIVAAPLSVNAVENADAKKTQVIIVAPPPDNYVTLMIDTPTRYSSQTVGGTLDPGLTTPVITTFPSATISTVTVTGNSWSARISGLSEGDNIISVTSSTNGNLVSVSGTIVLDTKSPDLTIDNILGTKYNFQTISGTVDDPPYHIVFVDVTCNTATAGMAVVAVPYWSAMITNLYYGDNVCTVTATDAAGNHVSKQAHIYYDNIPPVLDIHVNADVKYNSVQYVYGTVESGVTPTVTTNSLAAVSAVTVTGSNWSTYVSGLAEGANVVTVTAADPYGNVTTKTATITTHNSTGSFSGASQPSVADAVKALRYAVGLDVPTPVDIIYGDLYADGVIDVADAILILEKAIGLININVPNPFGL